MSTIVIMPGGFHPFHAGHAALYQSAVKAFPGAEVFVAATNDTSNRPFPFAIKEKLAKLAGVAPGHFVQVKSPFRAEEITAQFDPAKDRLIFVRSEKDAGKPPQAGGNKKDGSPAYLQPLAGQKNIRPFAEHAYMAYLPTVEFGPGMTSATEIRTAWPTLNPKRKTALVMSLYPQTQQNPKLADNVVKMLDTAIGNESMAEDAEPMDREFALVKKLGRLGERIVQNPKLWNRYDEAIDTDNLDWIVSLIQEGTGATRDEVMHLGELFGEIGGGLGRIIDFAWAVKEGKWEQDFMNPYRQHRSQGMLENQGWAATLEARDKKCPPATQDITINLKNRQKAIDEYGYGPLNPDMPNTKFWMKKVDEWNLDSMEEAQQSLCGNCAAFDIRRDTLDCIAQGIDADAPEDAEGVIDAGDLGYCKFLKFKCASRRTCDAWVTGGPLADKNLAEIDAQNSVGGMTASYQQRENQPIDEDYIDEKWSQKYKSSINCASPKGFSQRAHCAGRKK